MTSNSRVAQRHLQKRAADSDLLHAIGMIQQALAALNDAVETLDMRSDEPALSDDYPEAARASRDIRENISRDLSNHVRTLSRIR